MILHACRLRRRHLEHQDLLGNRLEHIRDSLARLARSLEVLHSQFSGNALRHLSSYLPFISQVHFVAYQKELEASGIQGFCKLVHPILDTFVEGAFVGQIETNETRLTRPVIERDKGPGSFGASGVPNVELHGVSTFESDVFGEKGSTKSDCALSAKLVFGIPKSNRRFSN